MKHNALKLLLALTLSLNLYALKAESSLDSSMEYESAFFVTMNHNKKANSTLNAFGVNGAFLNTLFERAHNIEEKWAYMLKAFSESYEFIPSLKQMMSKDGIPLEFLFLAMAESHFISHAKSSKKAIGIWQIMPKTAKELGLEISRYIDERKDPIKSTEAAIKYLKYLYDATGEWYLAAMAYNCGLNRLKRGIEEAGGDNSIETLLNDEAEFIPAETRNYIRTILAMSILFNDVDFIKSQNADYLLNRGMTESITKVSIKGGTSLSAIAKHAKISLNELKKYNPHFTRATLPAANRSYNIYLPYDKLHNFKKHFNEKTFVRTIETFDSTKHITHIVQKGDTLSSIARIYKVSIDSIMELNHLDNSRININQKLLIPLGKSTKVVTNADI